MLIELLALTLAITYSEAMSKVLSGTVNSKNENYYGKTIVRDPNNHNAAEDNVNTPSSNTLQDILQTYRPYSIDCSIATPYSSNGKKLIHQRCRYRQKYGTHNHHFRVLELVRLRKRQ